MGIELPDITFPPINLYSMPYQEIGGKMAAKAPTKAEKAHMSKVARLGCLICLMPPHVHHCGTHQGGGRDHMRVIPLCHVHHTNGGYGVAIHAGKKEFERIYGTEEQLLNKTEQLLKRLEEREKC